MYELCNGGAGYILYHNGRAIWETVYIRDMFGWMARNGIDRDQILRRHTQVVIFR